MKKIFLSISIFILGVVLVACSSKDEFKVDVFIYQYSDTYIGGVRSELERQLKDVNNVKYQFHDAAGSQETQNTQIDSAITAGTNLLVVNIVETASAATVITKAKTADLPIVFFNREISDAAVKSYSGKTAFIGTDPDEAGYMQGELAAEIILADYAKYDRNADGKIGYVMLRADLDNPEANGRTTYSVQEANKLLTAASKPALERLVADQMAGWDTATAKTLFDAVIADESILAKIDVVFANNDDMALGVIQSLKVKGFNGSDPTKQIIVLGVDATATAQEAIRRGEMAGSIKQDGEAMATALKVFIENVKDGKGFVEGTDYKFQTDVDKLRIPYAKYTGQ
ncbi:galactose ABC transporter substrate-binding protein [Haploplasma axanthum]|uniref:D-galactose/methyl-galactoside binding periplasmic protein MglB n=1 Tax=Haploplasma axanthum TaxID=29552 RepID=A0A449BBP4_HAPAX|nr:galactose ABC transporter substrate-binding protein [Haploplasma axanthum]VEU79856.1 D-galactose/ D-glucose-binding protein [Haploplasma axanthum]